MVVLAWLLGYFFWEWAVDAVRVALEASSMIDRIYSWLTDIGFGNLKVALPPLIIVFAITPLLVIVALIAVALCMTPGLVSMVAERRFPTLEKKHGGSFLASVAVSTGATLIALIALIVSLPLWLVPPLILVIPPLIWGWLTYRVMSFDALSNHASTEERRTLMQRHRGPLLLIGVICGYMGAAPGVVWASGALFAAMFVILVPVAIWIYTLVFAFSSLWFSHYCLAALERLRREQTSVNRYPAHSNESIEPQNTSLPQRSPPDER